MQFSNLKIYQPDGTFRTGSLAVADDRILAAGETGDAVDMDGLYAIPGLVDLHFHGCMGRDFCDGTAEAISTLAAYQAQNGVAAICPATMTYPEEKLTQIAQAAAAWSAQPHEAALVGINMEGPFISEKKKGAQNGAYLREPDLEAFQRLYDASEGLIRIADVAAELPGAVEFTEKVSKLCTVSIAHTDCTYDEAAAVFDVGARHLTHLYNAMPGIHHRKPGPCLLYTSPSPRDS